MPVVSMFYGIVIYIFYDEHNPPHFHAEYAGHKALITMKDGTVKGEMPKRALKLIFEWMEKHHDQLLEDWELSLKGQPLKSIEPLD
jgi:hypothetical protein